VVIAVPLAVLAVLHRDRVLDRAIRVVTLLGFAMPSFWIALLLMLFFGGKLRWLPVAGYGTTLGEHLYHLILPSVVIALSVFPLLLRTLRVGLLEVQRQDYVRTARAKGASESRILYRHVLRNALIPIVTLLGLNLPIIFSGALITENVFNYPGMGLLFVNSAQTQDYSVLLGITVIVALATVAGSLLADILYAVLDPRVRYVSA
jgi:peptide/nickel transport system permease protein